MTTICTVSGPLIDPTGAVLINTAVRFVRVDRVGGTGTATVVGRDITVTSNGSGVITVDLLAGSYTALVNGSATQFEFAVGVPDAATANLHDCIEQAPEITPGLVQQVVELRDQCVEIEGRIDLGALDAAVLDVTTKAGQVASNKVATDTNVTLSQTARAATEAARDVALAASGTVGSYAATTLAAAITAGIAAVADGAVFRASGNDVDRVETRRRSGSGSTLLWQEPKSQAVGQVNVVGPNPANTGTTASQLQVHIEQTAAVSGDIWTSLGIAVNVGGPITLAIVEMSGTTVSAIVRSQVFTATSGVNTFAVGWPLAAGQYRAVMTPLAQGLKFVSGGGGFPVWTGATALAVGATYSPSTTHTVQMQFVTQTALIGRATASEINIARLRTDTDGLLSVVGQTGTFGWSNIVATGSVGPARTILLADATTAERTIRTVSIGMASAGTATVFVATIAAGAIATIRTSQQFDVSAGVNTITVAGLTQRVGEFVGIAATGIRFQNSSNPTGQQYYDGVGSATPTVGQTVSLVTQHRWEFGVSWATGMQATTGNGLPAATGLDVMSAADATGVSDATAIAAAARASHPHPYVRPGRFAVTAIPQAGNGFYGPGRFVLGGRQFILPRAPRVGTLYEGLRQRLASCIGTGAPLIVVGDSITHWSAADNAANHWLDQLCGFANIFDSPGDVPIMTSFGNIATYTPAFYGVTFTGATTGGSRGPIGDTTAGSVILASGSVMSFTGTFAHIGLTYTQEPGAGTMTIARDGTTLATVNAAGTLALDRTTGQIATGVTTSATYTVAVSGGNIETTSLLRLGVRAATDTKRLHVMRVGRGSFTFPDFTAAEVTSMLTIAGHLSASPPTVMIALGVNDMASVSTAAAMKSRADALVDLFQAGGVEDVIGYLPMRPSGAGWATRTANYDACIAGLTQSYRAQGAQIIRPAFDLIASGLTSDNLHPNGAGNDFMAALIAEELSA